MYCREEWVWCLQFSLKFKNLVVGIIFSLTETIDFANIKSLSSKCVIID